MHKFCDAIFYDTHGIKTIFSNLFLMVIQRKSIFKKHTKFFYLKIKSNFNNILKKIRQFLNF